MRHVVRSSRSQVAIAVAAALLISVATLLIAPTTKANADGLLYVTGTEVSLDSLIGVIDLSRYAIGTDCPLDLVNNMWTCADIEFFGGSIDPTEIVAEVASFEHDVELTAQNVSFALPQGADCFVILDGPFTWTYSSSGVYDLLTVVGDYSIEGTECDPELVFVIGAALGSSPSAHHVSSTFTLEMGE